MNKSDDENSQRDALVEMGSRLFQANGYTATGVREIASAAGLPQGSFTNHFRSKERFGAEVLGRYALRLDAIMEDTLGDQTLEPADRLIRYFDTIEDAMRQRQWLVGCLIPNMAGEAPAHSEIIRDRLVAVLDRHTTHFTAVLAEIFPKEEAGDFAAYMLAAWHGTLLRMQVERTGEPIARFKRSLRATLLRAG